MLLFYVLLPVFVLGLALCFQMPVEGPMVKRIKEVSRQGTRDAIQCYPEIKRHYGAKYP